MKTTHFIKVILRQVPVYIFPSIQWMQQTKPTTTYRAHYDIELWAHKQVFTHFVVKKNKSRFTRFWGKIILNLNPCKTFDSLQVCYHPKLLIGNDRRGILGGATFLAPSGKGNAIGQPFWRQISFRNCDYIFVHWHPVMVKASNCTTISCLLFANLPHDWRPRRHWGVLNWGLLILESILDQGAGAVVPPSFLFSCCFGSWFFCVLSTG